jgi:hypothetical protein
MSYLFVNLYILIKFKFKNICSTNSVNLLGKI